MTHKKALGLLALVTSLVLTVGVGAASAVSVGGLAGKAASNADQSCADYSYGGLTNSCASTKSFLVPLTVASGTASTTIKFRARGASTSNNVLCKGMAMDANHLGYWATPYGSLSSFGTNTQEVTLSDLTVSTGAVYVNCSIDNGGKLTRVEWTE